MAEFGPSEVLQPISTIQRCCCRCSGAATLDLILKPLYCSFGDDAMGQIRHSLIPSSSSGREAQNYPST
jgi:hypothetical protein